MLTREDATSATGQRWRKALEARLAEHRTRLEADHGPELTQKLRGRIAELKELLALLSKAAAPADAPAPDTAAGLEPFGLDFPIDQP